MTLDEILQGIKEAVVGQATQPNGPDLEDTISIVGECTDPLLARVLEVKGQLVIRIKAMPVMKPDEGAARFIREAREAAMRDER